MKDTRMMADVRSLVQRGKDWLETPESKAIHMEYLPINQGHAVMWCDQLLRLFNTREEAYEYIGETFSD